jgi:hypothetical protein
VEGKVERMRGPNTFPGSHSGFCTAERGMQDGLNAARRLGHSGNGTFSISHENPRRHSRIAVILLCIMASWTR